MRTGLNKGLARFMKKIQHFAYWQVIALSTELAQGESLKRNLLDKRLLLWRDLNGQIFVLADTCLHQEAPLKVADFDKNRIVCPYHGWEYDEQGNLKYVPGMSNTELTCFNSIQSFEVRERSGFIWIRSRSPVSPGIRSKRPPFIGFQADLEETLKNDQPRSDSFRSNATRSMVGCLADDLVVRLLSPVSVVALGIQQERKIARHWDLDVVVQGHRWGIEITYHRRKGDLDNVGRNVPARDNDPAEGLSQCSFQLHYPNHLTCKIETMGGQVTEAAIAVTPIDTHYKPQTCLFISAETSEKLKNLWQPWSALVTKTETSKCLADNDEPNDMVSINDWQIRFQRSSSDDDRSSVTIQQFLSDWKKSHLQETAQSFEASSFRVQLEVTHS